MHAAGHDLEVGARHRDLEDALFVVELALGAGELLDLGAVERGRVGGGAGEQRNERDDAFHAGLLSRNCTNKMRS